MALRLRGHKAYSLEGSRPTIIVEPGGRFFQPDDILGYKHLEGSFEVGLRDGFRFQVTHDESTLRKTSSSENTEQKLSELWLFGCSFTYGWSVNDSETFPWLLQEGLPDYRVINHGVNGYGTIHTYLGLEQALKQRAKPELVIVNHADFHMERNTFSIARRKSVVRWNFLGSLTQPHVTKLENDSLAINYTEPEYEPWKISRHSALFNRLQDAYENVIDQDDHREEATIMLLERTWQLCKRNNVPMVIANVGKETAFISAFCAERNIHFVDIFVDWEDAKFNNRPYDSHPNAAAHVLYSKKLSRFLVSKGLVSNRMNDD